MSRSESSTPTVSSTTSSRSSFARNWSSWSRASVGFVGMMSSYSRGLTPRAFPTPVEDYRRLERSSDPDTVVTEIWPSLVRRVGIADPIAGPGGGGVGADCAAGLSPRESRSATSARSRSSARSHKLRTASVPCEDDAAHRAIHVRKVRSVIEWAAA